MWLRRFQIADQLTAQAKATSRGMPMTMPDGRSQRRPAASGRRTPLRCRQRHTPTPASYGFDYLAGQGGREEDTSPFGDKPAVWLSTNGKVSYCHVLKGE